MSVNQPGNLAMEKLAHGRAVSTMAVRLVQAPLIAAPAASAGFDNLFVDLEHNPLSLETTGSICLAAMQAGITPLVRVPTIGSEFTI